MSTNRRQHATFRYYGQLNDFLPPRQRHRPLLHDFEIPAAVKDMFESMGVPHPEVDLVLLNGAPVNFGRLVHDGDRVSVYPAFCALDLGPLPHLRLQLREHRFILDAHLGRLATYLRLLGLDASYHSDSRDEELAHASHREDRILLTRDCGLLKRSEVIYGYFVRATEAKQQAIEVLRRFDLFGAVAPFRRCLRCNAPLNPVAKESIAERLQANTRQYYDEFRICPLCDRIYWAGSHHRHMNDFVREILASNLRQHGNRD
jgi:uncharacterized protein